MSPDGARRLLDGERGERLDAAINAPHTSYGKQEHHPAFEDKAAVLATRIVKDRPLPGRNEYFGYLLARDLAAKNGLYVKADPNAPKMMEDLARNQIPQEAFTRWMRDNTLSEAPSATQELADEREIRSQWARYYQPDPAAETRRRLR